MSRGKQIFLAGVILAILLGAVRPPKLANSQRPRDPWAVRSVLDKKPRMLTLALNKDCYVAYDLAHCTFYKAWKGGISLDGAPYTDQKVIQPTSWGTAYLSDSTLKSQWVAEAGGKSVLASISNKGYVFRANQIYLKYALITTAGDTISFEERPGFVRSSTGKPGLERMFTTTNVPANLRISLISTKGVYPYRPINQRFLSPILRNFPRKRFHLLPRNSRTGWSDISVSIGSRKATVRPVTKLISRWLAPRFSRLQPGMPTRKKLPLNWFVKFVWAERVCGETA